MTHIPTTEQRRHILRTLSLALDRAEEPSAAEAKKLADSFTETGRLALVYARLSALEKQRFLPENIQDLFEAAKAAFRSTRKLDHFLEAAQRAAGG